MEKELKYKSYKELKEAYDKGELDPEKSPLWLDNDDCHVYVDDEKVFSGGGYNDLERICTDFGLPAQWV